MIELVLLTQLFVLLFDKNIRCYTRYIDDVLIIYGNNKTNSESITQQINQIHKDMRFNPTREANNRINFLDLQIIRNTNKLEVDIFENLRLQTPLSTTHQTILWNTKHRPTDITFPECILYH